MLWVVYGLPVVEFQVLVVTINVAGCAIEVVYLTLYLIYARGYSRVRFITQTHFISHTKMFLW
jgi:solute carrier family 50 protein (sugar transporter)